ncbi:hypothetical protein GCM10009718_02500 [Isoptericola halotolerans]|uniref:Transcriptional regulator with XRE-family HTH domain n=1 Tax=Isoptericola halotolerans TaxID=300560 RepID=A0ABX2A1T9_9MICO|nr:helix-turn-helix transcriptional regulator [Isoptericola halotolerans]NOV96822.1 transcriptional regulator with XRE-family HTH domain [Isoptericola halotolerans]
MTPSDGIRWWCWHHDVRQSELAVCVRVSPDELSQRMTGKRPFEADLLADIAAQFEVTVPELVTGQAA